MAILNERLWLLNEIQRIGTIHYKALWISFHREYERTVKKLFNRFIKDFEATGDIVRSGDLIKSKI